MRVRQAVYFVGARVGMRRRAKGIYFHTGAVLVLNPSDYYMFDVFPLNCRFCYTINKNK